MRHSPISRRLLLTGALAGATALAFARGTRSQDRAVLHIRHREDIANIDPKFYTHDSEMDVILALFPRLVEYKSTDTWEWALAAAEQLEQVDPTHIGFKLRPGIQWTGGFGELTAEDVKYSFERIIDPADPSPFKEELTPLERVEVTGTHTGVLVLAQPAPKLWSFLPWPTASIVSKKAMESVGGKFTTEPPATGGPYRIAEWVPKQKLVLARSEAWNGPAPAFDEVVILPMDDDKAAEIAFEAGEIDFTDVSTSSIAVFQSKPPTGGKLMVKPSLGFRWIGMNTEHKPFDDIRVRQAVRLAIDVPTVLQGTYNGAAERATGIIAPGMIGYREHAKYEEYNPEEAKRLLAEAGLSGGFTTTLLVERNTDNETLAQLVQANLAEVGITLEINSMESGQFWIQGIESEGDAWKSLQMFMHNWGWAPDPSSASQWWTPDQIGQWNWERWRSPEYGELHIAALTELDREKRAALYRRMQELMDDSAAFVYLTPGINPRIYRESIAPAVYPDGRHALFAQFGKA